MAIKFLTLEPDSLTPNAGSTYMGIELTERYKCPPILNRDDLDRDEAGTALGSDFAVGDWISTDELGNEHYKIASIDDDPLDPEE